MNLINDSAKRNALADCRAAIPALLNNKAYFNFGGQGTLPEPALTAIFDAYRFIQSRGPFSTTLWDWLTRELLDTRQMLATTFGGQANCYVLTQNVSEGCNIALWGQRWQRGDVLLMTDCEHESLINIAETLSRRFEITVEHIKIQGEPDEIILERLRNALTPQTKIFGFSHVLWNTGAVLPVREIATICKGNGTRTLVDGAQSMGVLTLDMPALSVDYYAFTGHKWLCGPEGAGSLYIHPEQLRALEPTFVGWRSSEMVPAEQGPDASRFEVATTAFPLLAGLRASIAFHSLWVTPEQRESQILKNAQYFYRLLSEDAKAGGRLKPLLDTQPRAGLVSFTVDGANHFKLVVECEKRGYYLRTIPEPDCIRASLHYFTSEEEIERLVQCLKECAAL